MRKSILILATIVCAGSFAPAESVDAQTENVGSLAESVDAQTEYVGSLAENVGVPSECEDVMLQAFYWDSYKNQTGTDSKYGRTKWVDLMKDTAAICRDFELVWFPPSAYADGGNGKGGVGYTPKQYSNQESDWGTKQTLQNLITALHKAGTKVIGDIVINHRGNMSNWCNFFEDDFTVVYGGKFQLTQKHICRGDEGFTDSKSSCYGAAASEKGSSDTGSNFEGARDLDHTSEYVQRWAKAYLSWMIGHMKYDGFRYDMTLGYHGRFLQMYNEAAEPYISVSECWDGINRQKQHLEECNYNTMVFDFPQKYELKKAFIDGSYGKLKKNTNSFRGQGLEKYAVTFVDNHDTFGRGGAYGDNQFGSSDLTTATAKERLMQAYAYLMSMPGVPCVFWPHWATYKEEISELIAIRKRVGIHSESQVLEETSGLYRYGATVQGHRGKVFVALGKNRSQLDVPEGFEQVADGDHYTLYIKEEAEGISSIISDKEGKKFLKDGELYIRCGEQVYDAMGRMVKTEN